MRTVLRYFWPAGAILFVTLTGGCSRSPDAGPAGREVIVLTTTTTQDSGILNALADAFTEQTGYRVKPVVAGSGDILKQGAQGEGDVLLTHSPEAEREWMARGHGSSRRLVMYNDFVVVGPTADPAGAKGDSATRAFGKIAAGEAAFVSRGDRSGTHVRELEVWNRAGIDPRGRAWYRETGQGQGLTMEVASQRQAYTLTDRGTFLVHKKRLDLAILVEGDPGLLNIYHVMPVNAARFPKVNAGAGQAFADWLVSGAGQKVVADFGQAQYGRSLFMPAAGKTEADLPNR